MDFNTLCIHGSHAACDLTGSVSVPIYQTATFAHPGVGQSTGYDYSRLQNPTREQLEFRLAELERGVDALAFSSGMAAVSAAMELFSPGDHLIASDDLYGGSHRLFSHISTKNGLSFDYVDTARVDWIESLVLPNTKAIFIETPSNPLMQVTDIAAVAEIAGRHQLLLFVDNTFLTPFFQNPLLLGADVVIHSGTKYLGGHNDTLAGFLVVKEQGLSERLRFIQKTTGACLAPFDSWLLLRGIKTLPLRMERQQANAEKLAHWLTLQACVKAVHFVGIPTHPGYQVSQKQASGFGAMISFETVDEQAAIRILQRITLIQYAESLGGVESLITYPMLQTHADVPKEIREAKGINERLLRLSVGIENIDDLIHDLAQAMEE